MIALTEILVAISPYPSHFQMSIELPYFIGVFVFGQVLRTSGAVLVVILTVFLSFFYTQKLMRDFL